MIYIEVIEAKKFAIKAKENRLQKLANDYKRFSKLYKNRKISYEKFENVKTAFFALQNEIYADKKTLESMYEDKNALLIKLKLAENNKKEMNISLISMHTNFDKTHLNRYVMKEVLGFEYEEAGEFMLKADVNMEFNELARYIKKRLQIETLNTVQCHDFIKTLTLPKVSLVQLSFLIQKSRLTE
jgi:hypothetical protein